MVALQNVGKISSNRLPVPLCFSSIFRHCLYGSLTVTICVHKMHDMIIIWTFGITTGWQLDFRTRRRIPSWYADDDDDGNCRIIEARFRRLSLRESDESTRVDRIRGHFHRTSDIRTDPSPDVVVVWDLGGRISETGLEKTKTKTCQKIWDPKNFGAHVRFERAAAAGAGLGVGRSLEQDFNPRKEGWGWKLQNWRFGEFVYVYEDKFYKSFERVC